MTTNPTDFAFPLDGPPESGLTKREHFAAMAMQGLAASLASEGVSSESIARRSVEVADLLIAKLNAV